ncbi:SpdD-like protein [Streptomyces zaomyceticus]|uniref:SpdD-like protein n=1 Tax=Streptomyces zaomyceticus TaxID=68286 RepID=UPI00343AF288
MLRPNVPVNPLPTGNVTPLIQATTAAAVEPTAPVPVPAPVVPNRGTSVQLTPGSVVALAAGGGAVVLVVGAVLVSMLLAVAITGVSVAVCAVVLKSLMNQERKR